MSYKYLIVSLRRPIGSFFEFEPEDISSEGFDVEKVIKVLTELYPDIFWRNEGQDLYFGSTPCSSEKCIEAWLSPSMKFLSVSTDKKDVIKIASKLELTAFDVQNGERLYSPDN